ncbi:hypothetical protein A0257_14930 [Hymenobacter psoromatis]|nr:hypothetical protein A0257_14930 [Hymenobacter psoromatis]
MTFCADYTIWEADGLVLDNPFIPIWSEVKFDRTSASSIPSEMGVYMFIVKSLPEALLNYQHRYILYVGQAVNLRKRFGEYFHYANSSKPSDQLKRVMTVVWEDKLYFNYFPTDGFSRADLTSVEFDLIDKIVPPMNKLFRAEVLKQYISLYAAR